MTQSAVDFELPRFGLYYPYVHIRDERWLKIAALYWPRVARIVPREFTPHDSEMVRCLADELDFTIDLDPRAAVSGVAPAFREALDGLQRWQRMEYPVARHFPSGRGEYITDERAALLGRPPFGGRTEEAGEVPADFDESPQRRTTMSWGERISPPSRLAGVYATEVDPSVRDALLEAGLATPSTDGQWLMMHQDLAWAYKCVLSEELAARNALSLATDQLQAQAVVGLPASDVVNRGLGNLSPKWDLPQGDPDYTATFGLMSLKLVVPEDLDSTPIEKIITVPQRFGEEFDDWRRHVDLLGRQLSERLADVEDPKLVDAALQDAVRQQNGRQLASLQRGLRDVGINAGEAAVTAKFEVPVALSAIGVAAAEPHLAAAAGVAVGVFSLVRGARQARSAQRAANPAAYLLEVQRQLGPEQGIRRMAGMMRLVIGAEQHH